MVSMLSTREVAEQVEGLSSLGYRTTAAYASVASIRGELLIIRGEFPAYYVCARDC